MYDKEPKLECKWSAVNWGAGDDFSPGHHQRNLSKGWRGLLKAELSEMHQYSLGAVCLPSITRSRLRESAPQTGHDLPLKSAAITLDAGPKQTAVIWQSAERLRAFRGNTVQIKTRMARTVIPEVERRIDKRGKVNIAKKSSLWFKVKAALISRQNWLR